MAKANKAKIKTKTAGAKAKPRRNNGPPPPRGAVDYIKGGDATPQRRRPLCGCRAAESGRPIFAVSRFPVPVSLFPLSASSDFHLTLPGPAGALGPGWREGGAGRAPDPRDQSASGKKTSLEIEACRNRGARTLEGFTELDVHAVFLVVVERVVAVVLVVAVNQPRRDAP